MQEMIFQASQGYPMPECLCYNTADLRMLTEFYSGRTSELTTTMQYSYQSTILSSCRPEIAEAIGKINMVEMRHISMLERLADDETLHAECLQKLIHIAGCCR